MTRHFALIILMLSCLGPYSLGQEARLEFLASIPKEHQNVFFRTIPFIAIDNLGVIYAADNRDNIVYKIDATDNSVSIIGRPGQGPGDLTHPWQICIEGDNLYVADDAAISTFKTTGVYQDRFRIFHRLLTFAAGKDKIYTVESGTEDLITQYGKDGERQSSFGKKYRPEMSIYKGWAQDFVDGTINDGKILIGNDAIYFISYFFAELFKYDLKGQFVTKSNLAGEEIIKKNRDFYFKVGQSQPADRGFETFRIIKDACYFNGKILILLGNLRSEVSGHEEIIEIDENDPTKRTRLPLKNIAVTPSSWGCRNIACGVNKWIPIIYASLYDENEDRYLIHMYKRVKR